MKMLSDVMMYFIALIIVTLLPSIVSMGIWRNCWRWRISLWKIRFRILFTVFSMGLNICMKWGLYTGILKLLMSLLDKEGLVRLLTLDSRKRVKKFLLISVLVAQSIWPHRLSCRRSMAPRLMYGLSVLSYTS